jgi:hypothetical protein
VPAKGVAFQAGMGCADPTISQGVTIMKKHVFTGLAVTALALMSASTTALADNAAYVIDNQGCGMFDQYGNAIFADADHGVINHGGKNTLKCYVTTPNDTGKVVKFSGFLCNANGTYTYRSWETIDTDGNATLTCQVK